MIIISKHNEKNPVTCTLTVGETEIKWKGHNDRRQWTKASRYLDLNVFSCVTAMKATSGLSRYVFFYINLLCQKISQKNNIIE